MTRRRSTASVVAALAAAVLLTLVVAAGAAASLQSDRATFRTRAAQGIAAARAHWWDSSHNWYDGYLNDHRQYPQATIWDVVPLFEAVAARAIDSPTQKNKAAAKLFGDKAERYWDPALRPHGGYAPYPGDRGGHEHAYFDDNGWWGIAFVDAYRATGNKRYLTDAARALDFIANAGWASKNGGGIWWETNHSRRAGEALASGSALAAMLYEQTGKASYLKTARRFLNWGDAHFIGQNGLYRRTDNDSTPMGYVEGPMIGAHEILCRKASDAHACTRAETLAAASLKRFGQLVNHGPQYDTIYLRWMLDLYQRDGDRTWYDFVRHNALRALQTRGSGGLYQRAWDGGSIRNHNGSPGMLQTHAATVALFSWLGAAPIPQG